MGWWNPTTCTDCKCAPTCAANGATDSTDGYGNCVCDGQCIGSGCDNSYAAMGWWNPTTCTDCKCAGGK